MKVRSLVTLAMSLFVMGFSTISFAKTSPMLLASQLTWDGSPKGTLSSVEIDEAAGNTVFRVAMSGQNMCDTTVAPTIAYATKSDPYYQSIVSMALAAKESHEEVIVYSNKDSYGYCHIGDITLH